MTSIGELFATSVATGLNKTNERNQADKAADRTPRPEQDRVELSSEARAEQLKGSTERIVQIRAELAAGTYLTDDKLDVAIDRLTRELLGGE